MNKHQPAAERAISEAAEQSNVSLSPVDREAVASRDKLSAVAIYSIILREGKEELERPLSSLWWSGVAAGAGICASILARSALHAGLTAESAYAVLIECIGYTFGFVLVILSRLQLFTENTITVVLPVLAKPSAEHLRQTARLWSVVLLANFAGTFLVALISVRGGVFSPSVVTAMMEIAHHAASLAPGEALLRGIPAGFLIAALVWMLPSARGSEVLTIMLFTWLIAAGGFTHVVAGSNEMFVLVLAGELSVITAFTAHIIPALLGNILGGTGLFALLAYGQVRSEM